MKMEKNEARNRLNLIKIQDRSGVSAAAAPPGLSTVHIVYWLDCLTAPESQLLMTESGRAVSNIFFVTFWNRKWDISDIRLLKNFSDFFHYPVETLENTLGTQHIYMLGP